MALTPPPPWNDLGNLLRLGIYIYLSLFIIALLNAIIRRLTARIPNARAMYNASILGRSIRLYRDKMITYATIISAFRMLFSTFVCVSYVYITYVGHISRLLMYVLKTIGVVLCVYINAFVATSDRPIAIVTTIVSVVEVLSLSSILFAKRTDWLNFSFLQAYGIMSSYFSLEPVFEVVFNFKWSQFQRQLARRAVEFIVFIYVFACGLQLFERMGEPWSSLTATTFELTLANSFYFTVVTLFTVGYGDFVPFTLLGRLWVIFIIVFGAYLISRKIGQVVDVVSDLRRGRGSFVKAEGTEHCVICGNVKWEYLKCFVEEFYQDEQNFDKKLVVMCDRPNWTEDIWSKFFFKNPQFREHVVYLEGSCVAREDLVRAQVETALAVFVLCNQHNPDAYGEDSETLKRILTIRSYTPNIPIYAMCALRDSMLQITFALEHLDENEANEEGVSRRPSMDFIAQRRANPFAVSGLEDVNNTATMRDFSDDDDDDDGLLVHSYDGSSDLKSEAICMQEVEMSLMAENVFCNGLSTLLANLILRIDPINKPTDHPWAVEYKIGSECRFEYVKLPMSLHNRKFGDIALIMYDYGVVLMATKRFMEQKWRAVTPDTVFKINTVGLIITYHSAQFLDEIMGHIADRVTRLFEESESDLSSRGVPSLDEEMLTNPDIPRHSLAGGYLAGDLSMTYEYSADEANATESPNSSVVPLYHAWGNLAQAASGDGLRRQAPLDSLGFSRSTETVPDVALLHSEQEPEETTDEISVSQKAEPRSSSAPPPSRTSSGRNIEDDEMEDSEREKQNNDRDGSNDDQDAPRMRRQSVSPVKRTLSSPTHGSDLEEEVKNVTLPPTALSSVELRLSRRKSHPHHVTFPSQPVIGRSGGSKRATRSNDTPSRSRRPLEQTMPSSRVYFGDEELPIRIKGHIVVCAIGDMSVMNLKYFLQRVWTKRGATDDETPVVAICPGISEDDETELSTLVKRKLFLIQGNSLSVKTLRSAQFDQAMAIVILACEDKTQVEEMDAKAMFTVMTLDYLLGEESETFVCTMLDAEESMQLLRAPKHPRRKGASLGLHGETYLQYGLTRSGRPRGMQRSSTAGALRGDGSSSLSRGLSFGALSAKKTLPKSMSFVGTLKKTYTNRRESIANLVSRGMNGNGDDRRTKTSASFLSFANYGGSEDGYRGSGRQQPSRMFGSERSTSRLSHFPSVGLGFEPSTASLMRASRSMGQDANGDEQIGRLGRYGVVETDHDTFSRPRDESFEKQRYASGEMMISSTFMTLLIREYAMPGLNAIVRKIFGAGFGQNVRSKRSWIRTINIPGEWIGSGENGQRMYREVFDTLLSFGAIAIGLYRAGECNVRIQVEHDENAGGATVHDDAARSFSGSFESFAGSQDSGEFEMGGESARRGPVFGLYEESSLMSAGRRQSYGAAGEGSMIDLETGGRNNEPDRGDDLENIDLEGRDSTSSDGIVVHNGSDDGMRERLSNSSDTIEGVRRNANDGDSDIEEQEDAFEDEEEYDVVHKYTCPNTGREAYYHEVPGGGNVLPYVYTNPEPYTLVSHHDAVYVLVAPHVTVPNKW